MSEAVNQLESFNFLDASFFLPQYTTASLAEVLISVSEFSADTRICNSSVSPTEMLLGEQPLATPCMICLFTKVFSVVDTACVQIREPFFWIETAFGVKPSGSGNVLEVTSNGTMREVQGAGAMAIDIALI